MLKLCFKIHRNEDQVAGFVQAASDEADFAEMQFDLTRLLTRLIEIRDWPHGFATQTCGSSSKKLSFQRVIVPLLSLLTKESVRVNGCKLLF
jgi:hypothetical protein